MAVASKPLFISLIPCLMGGEGHILPYHGAVRRSVASLGWDYQAWVPQDAGANLEEIGNWAKPILRPEDLEAEGSLAKKLTRIPQALQCGDVLAENLKDLLSHDENRPVILFLERFIHLQLLAIWWGLRQLSPQARQRLHFWILYRRDVHLDQTRPIYRWLQNRFSTLLNPNHCQLLTDSEPLGRSLENYFQQPFTVMPIPHTDFTEVAPLSVQADPIICWWPGAPREEKGWSVMGNLVSAPCNSPVKIQVIAAAASRLKSPSQGIEVHLVGDRLDRDEYAHWLDRAQIILLPYDPVAYAERTSGIFTEAIIAERIPLVSAGTWMAQELAKYQLTDLVINWSDPVKVWREIPSKLANPVIQEKLTAMGEAYRRYHCLDSYAEVMQKLSSLGIYQQQAKT